MLKNKFTILDIGSSKINLASVSKTNAEDYIIDSFAEGQYSGFYNGKFNSIEELNTALINCFNILAKYQKHINTLYVSVPSEFCFCTIKNVEQSFDKLTKIKENNIVDLHKMIALEDQFKNHKLINISPIYYELDDEQIVENPIGKKSVVFNSCISYVFAENYFINTITSVLNQMGIYNIQFTSTALAQALFLLDEKTRQNSSVVIDCGSTTTSVALINNNSLLTLNAFSLGGKYILSDIKECFNISYEEANALLKQIDLTMKDFIGKNYVVNDRTYSCKITNNIVLSRVEQIINAINACFKAHDESYFSGVKIFLTGGGLTYLNGAVEYLAGLLKKPVYIVKSEADELSKPEQSSYYGLIDYALNNDGFENNIIQKIYEI